MECSGSHGATPDDGTTVADALARGGIDDGISRGDLLALFRGLADADDGSRSNGAARLLGKLTDGQLDFDAERDLDGEHDGAVFGDRIAVLGLDRPIVARSAAPSLRLMFLDAPLPAGDAGRAVDTLLLLISPSASAHAGLRRRLLELLDVHAFRQLLAQRNSVPPLIDSVRALESVLAS
jgi:hypothetical protein